MTVDARNLDCTSSEQAPLKPSGDIVERLNRVTRFIEQWSNTSSPERHETIESEAVAAIPLWVEAAAEIERLRLRADTAEQNQDGNAAEIDKLSIRLADAESAVAAAWEEAVKCVPTNWLDSLLTGPDAPRGPLGNPDVEKLLLGIINRMKARASAIRAASSDKTAQSNHSPSTLNTRRP